MKAGTSGVPGQSAAEKPITWLGGKILAEASINLRNRTEGEGKPQRVCGPLRDPPDQFVRQFMHY